MVFNEKKEAIVIDPGMSNAREEEIFSKFIADQKLNLIQMVNTHCHIDHILGVSYVNQIYELPLYFHPNEQPIWDMAIPTAQMYSLNYKHTNAIYHLINHKKLHLGEDTIELRYTPGHSPGSISFYCPDGRWAIVGDTLFKQSIGRTDLPMGNHNLLINSIKDQLFSLPSETKIYSGHGEETQIEFEQKTNPFF